MWVLPLPQVVTGEVQTGLTSPRPLGGRQPGKDFSEFLAYPEGKFPTAIKI